MNTQMELWPEMAETWADAAAEAWEAREAAKEERAERKRAADKAKAAARRHERREAALVEAFSSGKVHPRHKAKAAKLPKVVVPKAKKAKGMQRVADIDAYWKARFA